MQASRNPIHNRPRFRQGVSLRNLGADSFVIMANGSGRISFRFHVEGSVSKLGSVDLSENRQHIIADEVNDQIIDNGNGTYTVEGETGNWHGDAFRVNGTITSFEIISQSAPVALIRGEEDVTYDFLNDPEIGGCSRDTDCPQEAICIDGQCVIERTGGGGGGGISRTQAGLGALAIGTAGYFFW